MRYINISFFFYRHVSEAVRRVDATLGAAGGVGALFSSQAVAARGRLRDACERAILASMNAVMSTQRYEEILWRKVYYDPYSSAKKIRKVSFKNVFMTNLYLLLLKVSILVL